MNSNSIYQGIVFSYPRNPLFLRLTENFIHISKKGINNYLVFTKDFYSEIKKDNTENLNCGYNNNIYLFKENLFR